MKRRVAEAAVAEVEDGQVLGVGTGSTVNAFIDALVGSGKKVGGVVSSSEASSALLAAAGFEVLDPNDDAELGTYVDGADEVDPSFCLIKGGGGALTREKILATSARRFVCIVDASKIVAKLGACPVPLEVLEFARERVLARLRMLGGKPAIRPGFVTDGGNLIVDVRSLAIGDPVAMERVLESIPGVVTCGIFGLRPADTVLVGTDQGVRRLAR